MIRWLLSFALALPLMAQIPDSSGTIYAGGFSSAPQAGQKWAATALVAKPVTSNTATVPTYAFIVFDAVPTHVWPKPSFVGNTGAGVAPRVARFVIAGRTVSVFVPTAAGFSWNGTSKGWQWNGGALFDIPAKGAWGIQPTVRFLKSSVNNNSDFQLIVSLLARWRKVK